MKLFQPAATFHHFILFYFLNLFFSRNRKREKKTDFNSEYDI